MDVLIVRLSHSDDPTYFQRWNSRFIAHVLEVAHEKLDELRSDKEWSEKLYGEDDYEAEREFASRVYNELRNLYPLVYVYDTIVVVFRNAKPPLDGIVIAIRCSDSTADGLTVATFYVHANVDPHYIPRLLPLIDRLITELASRELFNIELVLTNDSKIVARPAVDGNNVSSDHELEELREQAALLTEELQSDESLNQLLPATT